MLLSEKIITLKRDGKGQRTAEKMFLVTLEPNHYNLPVIEEVFNMAEVGKNYDITLKEIV
jgi:hypothetical protein